MAGNVRRFAGRNRALTIVGTLALIAGTSLGMVTAVGADDLPEATPSEELAPEDTTTTTAVPETTATTAVEEQPSEPQTSQVQSLEITPLGHTNPPDPEVECAGTGSNSFESDERADRAAPNDGECTYGNIGQGDDAAVLAQCTAQFGNDVTHFYNSGTASGTGNDDVTGAITPHPISVSQNQGTQLNVTPDPGVVIEGVFVKGGNAFNAYDGNEANMIPPLTGGAANFADISHYVVCYRITQVAQTGSLDVTKTVVGDANGATFTVEVDCDDGTAHDRTVALNSELVFDDQGVNQGPGSLAITGIPVGTECTVTEPDDGGASSVAITPNNGVVTITANALDVSVDVENTFIQVGGDITVRVDVDKQVVGNLNPPNGTQFVVNVTCTGDAAVNQNLTFTYPNGLGVQSVIAQIPTTGSITCTVTETDPGGVILEGYKINGGSIQGGAPVIVLNIGNPDDAVTVVNDPSNEIEVGGISTTLPFTGSTTDILLKSAAWLLVVGLIALAVTRRRRRAPKLFA